MNKEMLMQGSMVAMSYDFLHAISALDSVQAINDWINTKGKEFKREYHRILRVILTGKEKDTPPNLVIMDAIGLQETKERITKAMDLLDEQYDFKQLYELA